MRGCWSLWCGLLLGLCAAVSAGPLGAEENEKTIECSFALGGTWVYENGAFKTKTPEPLNFTITDIDLDRQTARLITGDKSGVLKIVRALNANHFLEVVNEGFLNLTTIYDKDPATGLHPAVHSRHLGVVGQPVFAQYAGTCTGR
jgi:hypothetical protein